MWKILGVEQMPEVPITIDREGMTYTIAMITIAAITVIAMARLIKSI